MKTGLLHRGSGEDSGKWLIIVASFFFLCSVGLTVWFQFGTKAKTEKPETAKGPVQGEGLEHYLNFAIDFRDAQGNYKVLLCDVALELNQGAKITRETADIRKTIYKSLKSKNIGDLIVARGKKALKKEIETELGKIIGTSVVKQVYFTRFTLM